MKLSRRIIWISINVEQFEDAISVLGSGDDPGFWRSNDVEFRLGFVDNSGEPIDLSNVAALSIDVKTLTSPTTAALMSGSISSGLINLALTKDDWESKTAYHAAISFTNAETNIGPDLKDTYWLVIYGETVDVPTHKITYGVTDLLIEEDGTYVIAPLAGANLVPNGATYDGSGHYVLEVIANRTYSVAFGAHDADITNNLQTVSAAGNFTAGASSITLNGTASATVTATIRTPTYYTSGEQDSLFLRRTRNTASPQFDGVTTTEGELNVQAVTPPDAPTIESITASGTLVTGNYKYKMSFVTPLGETPLSAVSTTAAVDQTTGNRTVQLGIPVSDNKTVTARKIYRDDGAGGSFKLLVNLVDNVVITLGDDGTYARTTDAPVNVPLGGLARIRKARMTEGWIYCPDDGKYYQWVPKVIDGVVTGSWSDTGET